LYVLIAGGEFIEVVEVYVSHFVADLASLPEALDAPLVSHRESLIACYEELIANSYAGMIGDPESLPSSMTDENLERVAAAFNDVLAEKPAERVSSA